MAVNTYLTTLLHTNDYGGKHVAEHIHGGKLVSDHVPVKRRNNAHEQYHEAKRVLNWLSPVNGWR